MEISNNNNLKLHERVSRLEENYLAIAKQIDDLKNNDLKHLRNEIGNLYLVTSNIKDKLNARPSWLIAIIMGGMMSILTALVVYILTIK